MTHPNLPTSSASDLSGGRRSSATDPRVRDNPTCSDKTLNQYEKRYRQFENRVLSETGAKTPQDLVRFLLSLKPTLRPQSFRFMRAFLRHGLLTHHPLDASLQGVLNQLDRPGSGYKPAHKSKQTSALKSKYVRDSQIDTLFSHYFSACSAGHEALVLSGKSAHPLPSKRSALASVLVLLGVCYGLRPSEWANTRVLDLPSGHWLQVLNGKNSNGRACGEFRYLPLCHRAWLAFLPRHGYDVQERKVQVLINVLVAWQSRFEPLLLPFLQWIDRGLFSADEDGRGDQATPMSGAMDGETVIDIPTYSFRQRRIGLFQDWDRQTKTSLNFLSTPVSSYSARHQFSANMHCVLNPSAIAELMGHASEQTASEHYAQARSGNRYFADLQKEYGQPPSEELRTLLQSKRNAQKQTGSKPTDDPPRMRIRPKG